MKLLIYFAYIFLIFNQLNSNLNAQNWDLKSTLFINRNSSHFTTQFFKIETESVKFLAPVIPLSFMTYGLIKKDKAQQKRAILFTISGAATFGMVEILKKVIKRPRPFETQNSIIQRIHEKNYSMPSGHSSLSFCIATALTCEFPKWYIIVPSYLWAASVAYSRPYLGVHYVSDILIGSILGSGIAVLNHFILKKWIRNEKH